MSFKLNWNAIEKDSFSAHTRELLEEALNSGKRPSILSDDIKIIDLNFGTIAPNFQILEIGDLGLDKFRGIFSFKYYGDASITVKTKISASLLKNYNNNIGDEFNFIKPNFIVSDCDFDIPLNLKLSNFKMSSIMIIVFSKTKGLTLVFKNDPLENIDVNSTFDKISPIADFLQKKIESQISDLFKEFLPSLLYKFSLKYTTQSFDQFHKDLLIEEQEEDDYRKKNIILLKDLDPENPFRISPGSLMRSTRLSSMRQTLSLGNGIDKLSCDRFNKDIITKAFLNILINKSNSYNTNRVELSDKDFEFGDVNDKLIFVKNFQKKAFLKNVNHKPTRRTIKMNVKSKKTTRAKVAQERDSESAMEPGPELECKSVPDMKSFAMDRSVNTSVFSDFATDTGATVISVPASKRPSMSRDGVALSRSVSSNNPLLGAHSNTIDAKHENHHRRKSSNHGRKSRRPSSSTMSTPPAQLTPSVSPPVGVPAARAGRKSLLSTKDAAKVDTAEEREIRRRIIKLDRLVNKKSDDADRKRLQSMHGSRHSAHLAPPPPYSR